jgi:hypothetical protein
MRKTLFAIVALILIAIPAPSLAEEGTATVYAVHGIPGQDLGLDPALPVDVKVGDLACLTDFRFGDRVGPLTIPSGSYDITVSLRDMGEDCAGTAVVWLPGVDVPAGANATIVAHRTFDGSAGAGDELGVGITASVLGNDASFTGRGKARLLAFHTALAPTVDVALSRDYEDWDAPRVTIEGFANPTSDDDAAISSIVAEFRPGEWDVALEADGATVFGPNVLQLKPFTATYVYAVGDFFTGSFQYLIYTDGGLREDRSRDGGRIERGRSGR